MLNKLRIATMILLAVSLTVPTVAFAEEETPEHDRLRFAGEITGVVPGQGTFTLQTRAGEELEFNTSDRTKYRSPDGSVEDIHDLKKGMKALVVAMRTDEGLLALLVAAGHPEDLPEGFRAAGEIVAVDAGTGTFELKPRDGDALAFQTGERTRYRGEGIEGIGDLKPGMHALVIAIKKEGELPLALLVAAGEPKDRPERIRVVGEITGVVPGQGTFSLQTREGEELEFSTSDRTQFRSRDGSIQSIHDLKKGMHAIVVAIETEDGDLLALLVAAGNPEDRPDRPAADVRAAGRIVDVGGSSFTLEKRDGGQQTFQVNENTIFKGVGGIEDLKVGMIAGVAAKETDGGLVAVLVAAREAPADRPHSDPADRPDRPHREPGEPGSDEPSQGFEA